VVEVVEVAGAEVLSGEVEVTETEAGVADAEAQWAGLGSHLKGAKEDRAGVHSGHEEARGVDLEADQEVDLRDLEVAQEEAQEEDLVAQGMTQDVAQGVAQEVDSVAQEVAQGEDSVAQGVAQGVAQEVDSRDLEEAQEEAQEVDSVAQGGDQGGAQGEDSHQVIRDPEVEIRHMEASARSHASKHSNLAFLFLLCFSIQPISSSFQSPFLSCLCHHV